MNSIIKKFLCKYFSDDNEDKVVTTGSFLAFLSFYIFSLILIIMFLYPVGITLIEINDCIDGVPCFNEETLNTQSMSESLGIIIIFVGVLSFLGKILCIILKIIWVFIEFLYGITLKKLLSIEITRCERKK